MTDATPTTPSEVPPARPGPPPLRIHHILVATAVVAAILSLGKFLLEQSPMGVDNFLQRSSGIVSSVSSGVALTLLGFGIHWRLEGRRFFDQPGHWLLLFQLFVLFFYLMLAVSWLIDLEDGPKYSALAVGVYGILLFLGWPIINFVAAWKGFGSRWWRWCFILHGVSYFAINVSLRFFRASQFPSMAYCAMMLVLIIAASVADLRAKRPRDWPNWVGVFITLVNLAVGIVAAIWQSIGSSS